MAEISTTFTVGTASGAADLPTRKGIATVTNIGANRVWYNLRGDATAATVAGDDMGVFPAGSVKKVQFVKDVYMIAETGNTDLHVEMGALIQ